MTTKEKDQKRIIKIIGNPILIDRELNDFRKSAMILSSKHHHLISKYPKQWVGIYEGKVKAHDTSYDKVLKKIDDIGIPRRQVIIRHIDKKPRAMIL